MTLPAAVIPDSTITAADSSSRAGRGPALNYLLLGVQLALAVLVVYIYRIENDAFLRVFVLAAIAAVVNVALPARTRLPFFVLSSLAGVFLVFKVSDGLWLVGSGLALVGLCHLPWSLTARAILISAVGAVLALSRGGVLPQPWSGAVWPILGSMFMFRLALYLMSTKSGRSHADGGPWWPLAYFFMLPNLVFPLFPVVDYQTLRRTYYDGEPTAIYQQGMLWIARGLVHLLAYRFVYLNVLIDPNDVVRLSDLLQLMLGTFLLYLRVSGQFHLIVGVLHLFGFKLPETHKMYYLAHSFTELWRRINIYWTDFMMKTVFYPTYFRVKQLGPRPALALSTVAVFVTTWLLHSYQWFWLRGGFPLTLQDTFFWAILGALVVRGALKESTAKKVAKRAAGWDWRTGLRAAVTFGSFCFLWSLWSTQSVSQWVWSLGAVSNVDAKGVVMALLAFGAVFVAGGFVGVPRTTDVPGWRAVAFNPVVRSLAPLVMLVAISLPAVRDETPTAMAAGLASLKETRLNARDSALQHRGYYEQLDVRAQLDAPVLNAVTKGADWVELSQLDVIRDRKDMMIRDLYPSRRVTWNGNAFTTNRWGMRDKDYTLEKPAETFRIAILGPSHVMGNGVGDGETFESLVEDRLNREFTAGRYRHFEILNFAVDGYSLPQQVALLEDRVFRFSPDAIIVTHYQSNRTMTESLLLKIVWGDISVPSEPLRRLLSLAGLDEASRGDLTIPFAPARGLARAVGLRPRMPFGESAARVRWIADDAIELSFRRLADLARAQGVSVAVLGLNVVIDDVASEIPNLNVIRELQLPTFDLFTVFPEAQRPSLRVAPWDDHPSAAGHRLIADALYSRLLVFLRPSAGAPTAATVGGNHAK